MFTAAFVTFTVFLLMIRSLDPKWLRRLAGHQFAMNLITHGALFYCFFGTSTEGFLQAEAAGIMFSLYFIGYRFFRGYECLSWRGWTRYPPTSVEQTAQFKQRYMA
jgi:hypothetical protein